MEEVYGIELDNYKLGEVNETGNSQKAPGSRRGKPLITKCNPPNYQKCLKIDEKSISDVLKSHVTLTF